MYALEAGVASGSLMPTVYHSSLGNCICITHVLNFRPMYLVAKFVCLSDTSNLIHKTEYSSCLNLYCFSFLLFSPSPWTSKTGARSHSRLSSSSCTTNQLCQSYPLMRFPSSLPQHHCFSPSSLCLLPGLLKWSPPQSFSHTHS